MTEQSVRLGASSRRCLTVRGNTNPWVLGQNGQVWLLGTLLDSVGSVSTALAPVPDDGPAGLRGRAEKLWAAAEVSDRPTRRRSTQPTASLWQAACCARCWCGCRPVTCC